MAHKRLRAAGRNARITRLVGELYGYLRPVKESSQVVAGTATLAEIIRHSWDRSATGAGASRGLDASNRYLAGSVTAGHIERLRKRFFQSGRRALERSTIGDLSQGIEDAVRSSWLYRWLTAEPEPEVIVIDLRETFSVAPVISLLDQLVRWLVPASHRSKVVGAADSIYEATRAAPIQVASLVLGVAVLSNLGGPTTLGEPTQAGVLIQIVLLGMAALGTRVSLTWDELIETQAIQLLIAALEPPEPPEPEE